MQDIRIHRGDIFWVRQDYAAVGSEARKNRPAIIVSNDKNDTYSETVEIVYLTTAEKKPMPTHVSIETMGKQSTALCEARKFVRLFGFTPKEVVVPLKLPRQTL